MYIQLKLTLEPSNEVSCQNTSPHTVFQHTQELEQRRILFWFLHQNGNSHQVIIGHSEIDDVLTFGHD